jgi:PDZ domain-containing protein
MIVLIGVLGLNIPYFVLTPGPAVNVLKLIQIQGAKTTRPTGQLLLTTVSVEEIRVIQAIVGFFRPDYQVVSRSTIVPPGQSSNAVQVQNTQEMSQSQVFAAAAALRYLGYRVRTDPAGASIEDVASDAPAASVLQLGDTIVGVDGTAVHTSDDFKHIIERHKVGDDVSIKIIRGTQTIVVRTKTVARPDAPSQPIVGVVLTDLPDVHLPLAVRINSLGIGGPSAGMMFAVGIVDLLSKIDVARGRVIAGTGEITVNGQVMPVGGVREKVAGAKHAHAQLFLVPSDESREACSVRGDLPVYSVDTLAQAIKVLTDPHYATTRACH